MKITIKFYIFKLIYIQNFSFNTIEFFIFKLVSIPIFSLNWQLWFFGPYLPTKGSYFQSKTDKIDTTSEFLHIQISLCIKFNFEQTILNFWTKFTQARYLCSKTEKMSIIIKFCIFKLVLVPNFSLNWQYWFFWLDLSKKVFSGLKQKKWTSHVFYIMLHIQISLMWNWSSKWQFWFFGSNLAKRVFPVTNRKSHYHHGILHIWISLGTKFQLKLIISSFWTNFT